MGQESDQLIYQSLDDGGLAPIDQEDMVQQRHSFEENDEAMDPDTKAAKEEIERTRERMSETIEAISERLDPHTLAQQVKDAARNATIGKVENAAKTTGAATKEALTTAGESISSVAHKVKDTIASVGEHSEVNRRDERVSDAYSRHSSMTVSGMGARIRGWGRQAQNGVRQGLEKRPLIMGVALVGIGALVGFILPETEQENRLLGQIGSRILSKKRTLVSDQVGQLPMSGAPL